VSAAVITVLEPGLLTSVQDVPGRTGWRHLGIPTCGAVDASSARLANRMVGNDDDAPLIEVTLVGPALRFERPMAMALAGADLDARLDGLRVPPGSARRARGGSVLRFGDRRRGARAYVAVAGGIVVEPVLGSAATDLRAGFGGVEGRGLAAGDRLEAGSPSHVVLATPASDPEPNDRPIRIVAGPHLERFGEAAASALTSAVWTVGYESDRAGVRLNGPSLWAAAGGDVAAAEVASVGLPPGAMQVPPDGQPIVMLADRPVTGGYTVVACVARADLGRVAQLVPGDELRFAAVSPDEAVAALRAQERRLATIRPIGPDAADGASWAGSLD
jgi:antagonist of KipI